MIDMWRFDDCIIMPYKFLRQIDPGCEMHLPESLFEGKGECEYTRIKR